MNRTETGMARVAGNEYFPKLAATAVLTGALISGADNIQTVSLTAATLAVTEVARNHFGVKGLRSSGTKSGNTRINTAGQPNQG